jgi:hypothetical protein
MAHETEAMTAKSQNFILVSDQYAMLNCEWQTLSGFHPLSVKEVHHLESITL